MMVVKSVVKILEEAAGRRDQFVTDLSGQEVSKGGWVSHQPVSQPHPLNLALPSASQVASTLALLPPY